MDRTTITIYIVLTLLIFSPFVIFGFVKSTVQSVVIDTVVKTERITTKSDGKYIVYGENEVYENVDSIWFGKFNSSDVYRDLKPGHKYEFTVIGWRVPFMSWYRNIVRYKEVAK